jgi:putative Holliday junction resolvase
MQIPSLKNKKIAAIDYGKRRIGFASCDYLHITTTPRFTVDTGKEDKYNRIIKFLVDNDIKHLVIGIPFRDDDANDEFIAEIREFSQTLKSMIEIEIMEYDESFSTIEATASMIESGLRKKKRADKATKDMVAAAVILKNFINMIDN